MNPVNSSSVRPPPPPDTPASPIGNSTRKTNGFIKKLTRRQIITGIAVLVIVITAVQLLTTGGGHNWVNYNKAVNNGVVKPADRVLEVSLLYDSNSASKLSVESSRILKHGYGQVSAGGYYSIQLLDSKGKVVTTNSFDVPITHGPPPRDRSAASLKPDPIPSQSEFAVTVPLNDKVASYAIKGLNNETYAAGATGGIKQVDNTPSFQSVSSAGKNKHWWNKLPFTGKASAAVTGNNNGLMDITYISDGYGDLNQFHNDVSSFSSAALGYQPYQSRASQIVFHYVDNTTSLGCSYNGRLISCDTNLVLQQINNAGAPQEIIVVLENNSTYGGSASGGDGSYGTVAVAYNGSDYGTAVGAHEMSHIVGALYDEYTNNSTDGTFDGTTKYNCYAGSPPSSVWGSSVSSSDYSLGCLYPNWYRSSPCSLMYAIDCYYFNTVSQQYLNTGIDRYTTIVNTSGPSAPVNLTATATISSVSLSWAAGTGGSAVSGFAVYRDGTLISVLPSSIYLGYSDSGLVSGSTHSYYVRAYDINNTYSGPSNTVTITTKVADTTPPTIAISSPLNGATVSGSIVIKGTASDNQALSKVQVQIDGGTLQLASGTSSWSSSLNTASLTNASHTITAKATDTSGNTSVSTITVSVNNQPADTTPPTVSITSPANGASVKGVVTVAGTSSDNVAVSKVQIKIDSGAYLLLTNPASWSYALDTTNLAPGTHTITVQAVDTSGNIALASININVLDTALPGVSITTPVNGATIGGNFNITGTASDNVAVAKVEIKIDAASYQLASGTTAWSFPLNTTTLSGGSHSITALATDSSGNTNTAVININVSNTDTTPPTITITSPANGATVSGSVPVSVNAADNSGPVAKTELYVDGALLATNSTSPYGFNWGSPAFTNATHTLSVKAYDAAGNTASDAISVIVSNADITPPSTPTGLSAAAAAYNNVNLSWTASVDNVGVAGYYIVRNGTTIAQTFGTGTTYSDTSVVASASYNYQVMAYDAKNNTSGLSATAAVTTPAAPDTSAPTAPSGLTASAVSYSQINLAWGASTDNVGVAGYDIYRNSSKIATVAASIGSYGDTGLTANTNYSYYVIARDAAGNQSPASNIASATTPSAPPVNANGTLSGTIYSNKGGTLSGSSIVLSFNGSRHTYSSDFYGNYFISLPPASYSIKYSHQGFYTQTLSATVTSNQNTVNNVTLVSRK